MNKLFETTRVFWGKEIKRGNLVYPNEQVIRFIKRYYSQKKEITVLDFGCGGGRNTVALLNEGYNVIAMDYTDEAIEMTKEKCDKMGFKDVKIVKNDGVEIPLSDKCIDAVIADGSLFYNSKNDTRKIIINIGKTVKLGGMLWADFRTKKDALFGGGTLLDDGLYLMSKETNRGGCTYFFADENDLEEIFRETGFEIASIDDYEYSENNRKALKSWFHVIAKKCI